MGFNSKCAPLTARIVFVLSACALAQGCYLGSWPMTYLSPHPVGGDSVILAGESQSPCNSNARFFTRTWASVTVAGNRICFTSPKYESGDATHPADPETSPFLCAGFKWQSGMLRQRRIIFVVTVEGDDLVYDQAVAVLDTRGRSTSAKPTVHLYPAVITPKYTLKPKATLAFLFDEGCDVTASYRLTLNGIVAAGRALAVPPVDFEPVTETVPTGAD